MTSHNVASSSPDHNPSAVLLLVVDLECTCDHGDAVPPEEMEIIEIGAVWVTAEGQILDTWNRRVRPTERPQLTEFATTLTGIRQVDVDRAQPLQAALQGLSHWLEATLPRAGAWGSWGAFDANQLARECERKNLHNPLATLPHRNLKGEFAKVRRIRQVGVQRALALCDMQFEGRHHRGVDDAKNIARLVDHIGRTKMPTQ